MRWPRTCGRRSLAISLTTDAITGLVRESFGRVVYSHKTHEKDRERYTVQAILVKWVNIVLIGLTGGGLVTSVLVGADAYLWASAVLATLALAFNVFQLSFDPATSAARHRDTAKSLIPIRDGYASLLADLKDGLEIQSAQQRRDSLDRVLHDIYQQAPDTSQKAYRRAQKALQLNDEMTFSDDELDRLLPSQLRSRP